jgi:hypothetical protein
MQVDRTIHVGARSEDGAVQRVSRSIHLRRFVEIRIERDFDQIGSGDFAVKQVMLFDQKVRSPGTRKPMWL